MMTTTKKARWIESAITVSCGFCNDSIICGNKAALLPAETSQKSLIICERCGREFMESNSLSSKQNPTLSQVGNKGFGEDRLGRATRTSSSERTRRY